MQELIKKYIENQPNKAVTKFDITKKEIKYHDHIKRHREVISLNQNEELIRAYLITKLVNELDYKTENIEIEKEYNIGRPKVKKARIDLVLNDNKGNPFIFLEAKTPEKFESDKEYIEGQLFALAKLENKPIKYLVYYSIDLKEDENISDNAIIIDFQKYPNYEEWEKAGFPSVSDTIPEKYEKAQKIPLIKGSQKDLNKIFSSEYLDGIRKNLHNVLWGGGSIDDNEIFASLVRIILSKIQDEEEREVGQQYEFQVLAYGNGNKNGKDKDEELESPEKVFERINNLYRRALKHKLNYDEKDIKTSYIVDLKQFSLNKFLYTIQQFEKYSFKDVKHNNNRDILGDFFESILRDGFKQTKGQFFTHTNVVKFILLALELDELAISRLNNDYELPFIIDPSAGSGTYLIEAMKMITHTLKYKRKNELRNNARMKERFLELFPEHKENSWAKDYIYGIETNFNLGTATKVNMILHGDGSTNIFVKDGLKPFRVYTKDTAPNFLNIYTEDEFYNNKEVNKSFDVAISNPPFSVNLDLETQRNLEKSFLFHNKKNSENLFIERWYQLLREKGRLGVVLPESVFDTTENKYIRLFLYKYFNIKAVVSLPQLTFEPYTSTKTSLLFAQKKTSEEIKQWNELWNKYSNEYTKLKTRVNNYIDVYLNGKDRNKLTSIKNDTPETEKENIIRFLKDFIEEDDKNLNINELLKKYESEINELSGFDNDLTDIFGFVNVWWVFGEVAKELEYSIFMAEAENVGYKRTKRGENSMPNDLYQTNKEGNIIFDTENPVTILDHIRGAKIWE